MKIRQVVGEVFHARWNTTTNSNILPRMHKTQLQDDSLATGPKLLSIKIIHTFRERCERGPAHNQC